MSLKYNCLHLLVALKVQFLALPQGWSHSSLRRKAGSFPEQWPVIEPINNPRGGVLGISSDGDDQTIFLGLKFSIPGFFWVRKFGLGSLI